MEQKAEVSPVNIWSLSLHTHTHTHTFCTFKNHKYDHTPYTVYYNMLYFLLNKFIFFYLFLAELCLRYCVRAFSSCSERGLPLAVVCGLLTAVASPAAERGLKACRLQQLWLQALERRLSSCGARA